MKRTKIRQKWGTIIQAVAQKASALVQLLRSEGFHTFSRPSEADMWASEGCSQPVVSHFQLPREARSSGMQIFRCVYPVLGP